MKYHSRNITELLDVLAQAEDLDAGQGALIGEIQKAESSLGCRLPDDYKEFLVRFGWGGRADWELFGLGADAPPYLRLEELGREERDLFRPGVPPGLVPIMNDGGSYLYCLDCSNDAKKCPVLALDLEERGMEATKVGDSFTDWIAEYIFS